MARVDSEVMKSFWDEALGCLQGMEQQLATLRIRPEDRSAREELQRRAHNLRGASGMVGRADVADMAKSIEELVEQVSDGSLLFDAEIASLLGESLLHMRRSLDAAGNKPKGSSQWQPEPNLSNIAAELIEGFVEEAEEHLQATSGSFPALDGVVAGSPRMQEVRRSIHTIKGAAGMVGLKTISELAHRMEDLLDQLYEGNAVASEPVRDLLVESHDALSDLVQARGRVKGFEPVLEKLFSAYETVLGDEGPVAPNAPALVPVPASGLETANDEEPERVELADAAKLVRIPLDRLDELVRLSGELFVHRSVLDQQVGRYNHELSELALSLQRLRRISGRLETEHASLITGAATMAPVRPGSGGRADHSEFDALELDRYTELALLSRELAEAISDINSAASQFSYFSVSFDNYVSRQGQLTGEVQDKMMKLRMVPLATLASRLERTVRVTARDTGKQARFVLEGGDTEVDKVVLERIAGPLEHLLRNAVDHGLEAPEVRRSRGKDAYGTVRLRAHYEGTEVTLVLQDDGVGLNARRLRDAAVYEGAMEQAEADALPDEQAYRLAFLPGLSTAAEVSGISGRGVGLDSVKAAVEALRGAVQVESSPGAGTTFRIRLPLTLAAARVTMIRVGAEQYALPVAGIVRTSLVPVDKLRRTEASERLLVDGADHQVIRLAEVLGLSGTAPQGDASRTNLTVLQVTLGSENYALVVDEVLEARQIVVKALSPWLKKAPCMTGATVLGDGRVVLILNPTELFQPRGLLQLKRGRRVETSTGQRPLDILIVDDSISVRRVVANVIMSAGWNPIQAKDGVEALELLHDAPRNPDAILMDIEMPRMDGFELTARLRSQERYKSVPILMLTSRAGEKHRTKAMSAGVTDYLIKPFHDKALLAAVRRHVADARSRPKSVA